MPRIFGATFQPFTYEEYAAPLREMTLAHQKVEEDYNNNMLVVDSLRQRAASEPDANWSKQIMDYANNLEAYATDLARNGLTRETRFNLLQAKRGYGTTVSPVLMAILREKELQSVRDKNPDIRNVFSKMPTIDEIIANPNAGQNWYSGAEIFNEAQALGDAASKRNVETFSPQNISNIFYRYGKTTGFTNDEIADIEKNTVLGPLLQKIYQKYGWNRDFDSGSRESNQLKNEAITGMLAGISYNEDWHYNQRPDYHDGKYWLEYEKLDRELHPEKYGTQDFNNPQDRRKPRLPELDFGVIPLLRNSIDNSKTRYKIINDKNIVTGITLDVNGGLHYNISQDYVRSILDGLNSKNQNKDKWSNFYIYSPTVGGTNRNLGEKYISESILKAANNFGITKNDTVESATRKIQKFLEYNYDYTDMADATLHTGMRVWLDPTNYNDIKQKYSKKGGSLDILELDSNGNYVITGKRNNTLKLEDYNPTYVFVDQNGPYLVWQDKEGNEVVTPYYDQKSFTKIRDEYNNSVMYYQGKQNELFNNIGKTIKLSGIDDMDRDKLARMGYNKGIIQQEINKSGSSTYENMNIAYKVNRIVADYYENEAAECVEGYNNAVTLAEKEEFARRYKVAMSRMLTADENIELLNTLSSKIDESASGINEMIMTNLPVTNEFTGQKYQGYTFKPGE